MTLKKTFAGVLALGMAASVCLTGCSGKTTETTSAKTEAATQAATEAQTEVATTEAKATEAVAESGTRVIKDFYGNEVEINANASKIVTGKTVCTNLAIIVGGTDCLACFGQGFNYEDGNLCKAMFPGLDDMLTIADNDMNAETLLTLDADAVLISSSTPDGTEVGEALKESGIPVVYYNLGAIDDVATTVNIIAEILGTDEAKANAEAYVDYFNNTIAEVKEAVKDCEGGKRVAYSRGTRGICGPNSAPGEWLTALGAVNIGDELGIQAFMAEVTVEEFLNTNPEIIICEHKSFEELFADPQYSEVDAVKNAQIYTIPNGLACSGLATSENPLVWYYAANLLYPDTCNYDMEAKYTEFFKTFYGYELSAEELAVILQ